MKRKITKNIVWIALGPIGDALMLAALLDEALSYDPDLDITVFALRNPGIVRELLSGYPRVRVISADTWPSFLILVIHVVVHPVVLFLPPTFGSHALKVRIAAALARLRPGGLSVSFTDKNHFQPYSIKRTYDFDALYIDNLRRLMQAAGIRVEEEYSAPRVRIDELATAISDSIDTPYILLHPFASNPIRSLPPKRWQALMRAMHAGHPGVSIVVTGSEQDRTKAEQWFEGVSGVTYAFGLSLREVAYLLKGAQLYIGVDTGITHLAGVLRRPSIVIGSRSNPTWLPTYNPNAIVLTNAGNCTCKGDKSGDCYAYEDGQRYYRCLYEISDETILEAVEDLLAR